MNSKSGIVSVTQQLISTSFVLPKHFEQRRMIPPASREFPPNPAGIATLVPDTTPKAADHDARSRRTPDTFAHVGKSCRSSNPLEWVPNGQSAFVLLSLRA